jgi:hypothetical protein
MVPDTLAELCKQGVGLPSVLPPDELHAILLL